MLKYPSLAATFVLASWFALGLPPSNAAASDSKLCGDKPLPATRTLGKVSENEFRKAFVSELCSEHEFRSFDFVEWAAEARNRIKGSTNPGQFTIDNFDRRALYPVESLLNPAGIVAQHGLNNSVAKMALGKPGAQDSVCAIGSGRRDLSLQWHRPDNWSDQSININLLSHPKALLLEAHKAITGRGSKYDPKVLIDLWFEIWVDFAINNWPCGMELENNKILQSDVLNTFGLNKPPPMWASGATFRHQFWLSALVENFLYQLRYLIVNLDNQVEWSDKSFQLARIVHFIIGWPYQNLLSVDPVHSGATNQWLARLQSVALGATLFPEFKRTRRAPTYLSKAVSCLAPLGASTCPSPDTHPDGSGAENAFNYMAATTRLYRQLAASLRDLGIEPSLTKRIEHAIELRERFEANWITPTGNVILVKNSSRFDPTAALRLQPPSYTSIAFPFHGLYLMRGGWDREALFLSLHNPRRGSGHEAEDAARLTLEAFGRSMIVSNPGEVGLFGSSFSQTTVTVDGLSQSRTALPRHGAYADPQDGRWSTSETFDVAEVVYRSGYGLPDGKGVAQTLLQDVQHRRIAIFLRDAKVWIVLDAVTGSPNANHTYSQNWQLNSTYLPNHVKFHSSNSGFFTEDPGGPNISAFQSSSEPINYRIHYGEGWAKPDDTNTEQAIERIPLSARGWQNVGGGYSAQAVRPSPVIESSWTGSGQQAVITLLVPSKKGKPRQVLVSRQNRLVGISAQIDGALVVNAQFNSEPRGHGILTLEQIQPDGSQESLFLPMPELGEPASQGYEETTTAGRTVRRAIQTPSAFRWRATKSGPVPEYD
jgi:hypothetical protein